MLDEEQLVSPSKRKKKQTDEVSIPDSATTESTAFEDDESEASTAATSVVEDDGLPHPRVSPQT